MRGALPWILLSVLATSACGTSTQVDEFRPSSTLLPLNDNEKVVVVGRRHSGAYETDPDFINCIGTRLANRGQLSVMPEQQFLDSFYPWFEPRMAPLGLKRMGGMLEDPLIGKRVRELGIRYMIWVDGNTETTEKSGAISCAVAPGGGGCFGFSSWDKAANYEAIIWDLDKLGEKGRVQVDSKGSSYLLAVGAPIPFIARVQGEACEGIGTRLQSFFAPVGPGSP
ncbi:hypothetical protein [Porticoccus sp.]|uniref:hypothetical protein n=1 Tax=Porticoccus sp. TaxID=2024853 RepID=UPI002600C385|nr:hypothetical protein [Porticoccus sp.]